MGNIYQMIDWQENNYKRKSQIILLKEFSDMWAHIFGCNLPGCSDYQSILVLRTHTLILKYELLKILSNGVK